MRLKSPITGDETDCILIVRGVDSKTFRDCQKREQRKIFTMMRDGKDEDVDDLVTLVEAVIGWKGFEDDGKELKFSKENVRALFENSPSIARQVETFIHNRRNFIKG